MKKARTTRPEEEQNPKDEWWVEVDGVVNRKKKNITSAYSLKRQKPNSIVRIAKEEKNNTPQEWFELQLKDETQETDSIGEEKQEKEPQKGNDLRIQRTKQKKIIKIKAGGTKPKPDEPSTTQATEPPEEVAKKPSAPPSPLEIPIPRTRSQTSAPKKMAYYAFITSFIPIVNIFSISYGHLALKKLRETGSTDGKSTATIALVISYGFHLCFLIFVLTQYSLIRKTLFSDQDSLEPKVFESENLQIANHSFEKGHFAGWKVQLGGTLAIVSDDLKLEIPKAQNGKRYAWAGALVEGMWFGSKTDWAAQRINLSKHREFIDQGKLGVKITAWGFGDLQATGLISEDGTFIEITFFDAPAGGTPITKQIKSNLVYSVGQWEKMFIDHPVPKGTRSIDIRLVVFRSDEAPTFSGFDNVQGLIYRREK